MERLRLASSGDAPVDLEPVLLVARLELSHPLARSAVQPRVPLEGRVDFQEAVVDRLAHPVEDHLYDAEPLVDGLEERVVLLLRGAQRFLRPLALGDIAYGGEESAHVRIVEKVRKRPLHPAPRSVLVPDAVLEVEAQAGGVR